jgi:hypothetical protein
MKNLRLILETNFQEDRRDFGLTRGVDEGAYPQRSVPEEQRSARPKDQGISEIRFENQSNNDIEASSPRSQIEPAKQLFLGHRALRWYVPRLVLR